MGVGLSVATRGQSPFRGPTSSLPIKADNVVRSVITNALLVLFTTTAEAQLLRYGPAKTYRIEHEAVFSNGDADLSSVEIWLPVPQSDHGQEVGKLTTSPETHVWRDATATTGVAKLYQSERLPGHNKKLSFLVRYELTTRAVHADRRALSEYAAREYTKNDLYKTYTRPEKKIELHLPEITAWAKAAKELDASPVKIARRAYDEVLQRTTYQLIDGFGGAEYCLKNGHGECGDYSALFVAYCRAAGVPARPAVGVWANQTNGWHVWAEFLLPTGEWIPVDCSIGDQNARNREFYFGSLDDRRVAFCRTFDIQLTGVSPGHDFLEFVQAGAWWWHARRIGQRRPSTTFEVRGKAL